MAGPVEPQLSGLLEVALYVDDVNRSVRFYLAVLGFDVIAAQGVVVEDTRRTNGLLERLYCAIVSSIVIFSHLPARGKLFHVNELQ